MPAVNVAVCCAVGDSADRALALTAWRRAKETISALGVEPDSRVMHHDQDPVYTSYAWTVQLLLSDHLQLSYSLDGARGNTEMEAFISRFKSENCSLLLDAATIETLAQVVNVRMYYYNEVSCHSVLDNQPPSPWLKRWLAKTKERRLSSESSLRNTLKRTK